MGLSSGKRGACGRRKWSKPESRWQQRHRRWGGIQNAVDTGAGCSFFKSGGQADCQGREAQNVPHQRCDHCLYRFSDGLEENSSHFGQAGDGDQGKVDSEGLLCKFHIERIACAKQVDYNLGAKLEKPRESTSRSTFQSGMKLRRVSLKHLGRKK